MNSKSETTGVAWQVPFRRADRATDEDDHRVQCGILVTAQLDWRNYNFWTIG
jgi:hypothetical protein